MPFLKKVVVVEDEDAVAHLIEASLGDAGYLCLRARDGEEAIRTVTREDPDLLILDILMPKMDGLEVVKRLKADPVQSKIPVLMLTALGSVDDRVRGLGAGADDYLSKPFDVRELLARAQALVRHNRRERDRSATTGLPGPDSLDQTIRDWLAAGQSFALLFVELSHFDKFVAEQGWLHGQVALQEVAAGLKAACDATPGASLMHLGGDDFAALSSEESAASLAEKLRQNGGHRAVEHGLSIEVTRVGTSGAKTTDDIARAVTKARSRRTPAS
jgi:PleD family two-component response regulator